jgi:hypothetical protein
LREPARIDALGREEFMTTGKPFALEITYCGV